MNSMFRRTLAAFLLTVLVIVGILAAGLFTAYNRSLRAWSTERQESVERNARETLRGSGPGTDDVPDPAGQTELMQDLPLPSDVPVFIYDRDRRLVASNRGVGRRREMDGMPMLPVRDEQGTVLGYYSVGAAQFHADAANRALMEALIRAAVAAFLAAVAIAAVSVPLLARYLSRPAAEVAAGIDRMAEGELMTRVPEIGAREIAGIARSANMLARRLEGEQHIRAQWVQDVAHDLRSPVAMIKAQLEAISDGVYRADPERLARLLTELGRVETLINDLDELMRLEAPELRPNTRPFSAEAFLESLRERYADHLAEREVVMESVCETPTITGDENLLYRAVSNVLSNAIRHTGNGGGDTNEPRVRCSVEPLQGSGDGTRVSIWNGGTPVPPEELSRVFERLYRGEYARNTPGSGLGLTIARRIVQLHGGTIRMDSAAGAGTTVTMDLPLDSIT